MLLCGTARSVVRPPRRGADIRPTSGPAASTGVRYARPVDDAQRASAEWVRSLLVTEPPSPAAFRSALTSVPPLDRDAWVDLVLELDALPEDGPELPRGCVPYLPCSVDVLLRLVDHAGVERSDVFVDVGSGVGRAGAVVNLLTGAAVIGLEIQPALALASRALTTRFQGLRFSPIVGDATTLAGMMTIGSVFFFYCPFGVDRLDKVLDDLEAIARTREIRICCVDLPAITRPWLTLSSPPSADLAVYRSTLVEKGV